MKLQMDTRIYTNFILSVIAALLLALTLHQYGVSLVPTARAQDSQVDMTGQPTTRFARPGRSAPTDVSNVPQMQDTAVAAATHEVAAANRDIAAAIRELARGVETYSSTIQTAPRNPANVTTGATRTDTTAPTMPADATRSATELGPVIEVR